MTYRPQIKGDLQWDEVKPVDDPRYREFPSDPDGRMNAITSSLNNGMKALMWSVGLSDGWRTPSQIQYYVKEAVGDDVYVPQSESFMSYAKHTMRPVGAIVQTEVRAGERWRNAVRLTKEGEHFKPVVNHTIRYFVDNKLDFYEVFAIAQRGAPKTRIDILRILAEKGEQRIEDLAGSFGLSKSSISGHAKALKETGLISFESASSHEGKKGFSYVLKEPLSDMRELGGFDVKRVKKTFKELGCTPKNRNPFTYTEFAEAGGYIEDSSKMILSRLSKAGFVKSASSFRGGEVHSSLKPNKKTIKFYNGWIVPVSEALETGDVSQLSVELDREHYVFVANRFRETSPSVNKISEESGLTEIIGLIERDPGITAKEISGGMHLSESRVREIINLAEKLTRVTSVPSKTSDRVKCFYPVALQD